MDRRVRHSLSGKLTLLYLVITVLLVVLVGSGISGALRQHFKDNVRPHLEQYLDYVRADIGVPPRRERAAALADKLHIGIDIIGPEGSWSSSGTPLRLEQIDFERRPPDGRRPIAIGEWEEHQVLVSREGDYTLVFTLPERPSRWGWHSLIPLGILLAVLVLLYHATRRLFAPIDTLRAGVERIGAGVLDKPIEVKRQDELGSLASSINGMADDIRRMLEAKRELLLAISHELRSPLTRAKLSAEFIDDEKQRADMVTELNAMEALIDELLETERLSGGRHTTLNRAQVNWQELVAEVIQRHFSGQPIGLDLPEAELELTVDAARMRLLLKNLLENALRHTPEGRRPPLLSTVVEGDKLIICVVDNGNGIEAQHIPHLTEPFYRVDPSRRRETGGYGLGLYLCRMIAEAHGGSLGIESTAGEGTTITIRLPLA